ncbi:MAG: DUF1217 domain-containing protein [Rhizobiaceae bacterium]|nr:DUF1217 domain-containing protein [Rhizobiaceae bacterium]
MPSTYASYLMISRDLPKALSRVEKQPVVDRESDYYLANIGKVKTIEEFVKNDRLFKFAMKAHGLEDMTYAKAFMIKALKEGIATSDTFANKLTDKRYAQFVASYNFAKYGEHATTYTRALHEVPGNFDKQVKLSATTPGLTFMSNETGYYLANIGNVTSIDDFMGDSRLLSYALTAFGLDSSTEPAATIRTMLEGGVTDPASPANSLTDKRYANFVTAFNFVENGAATTSSTAATTGVAQKYVAEADVSLIKHRPDFITSETAYFKANITKITSINALMGDSRLLTYAMGAFGLDAKTEDMAKIRNMLVGGIQNPASPANVSTDKRYAAFVTAFNFEQYGDQATQQDSAKTAAPALWAAKAGLGLVPLGADYLKSEQAYYLANVTKVDSIADLMADSRLLTYALWSHGLDPAKQEPATIRKLLEGGVSDPNSPANKLTDKRYAAFVTTFDFAGRGSDAVTETPAQTPTVDKYVRQTLEENAGKDNEGVRLALYFERKASTITNFYSILADPALAKVVRTMLNVPEAFARADIDQQVKFFEKKLNIADLQDPKKVQKLMQRFTSLWELSNPTQTTAVTAASVMFGQPTTIGISTDLLLTMQRMRF